MSFGGYNNNNSWKRKAGFNQGGFNQGGGGAPKRSFASAFQSEESIVKGFAFNSREFILNDDDSMKLCTNPDCGRVCIPVVYRISQNGNTIYDYECPDCRSKISVTAVDKMKHLLEQSVSERLGGDQKSIELYKKLANADAEGAKQAMKQIKKAIVGQTASPEPANSIADSVSKKLDEILITLHDVRDVMLMNDAEYRGIFKSIEEKGHAQYKRLQSELTRLVMDMAASRKQKDTTKSMLESQSQDVNPSLSPLRTEDDDNVEEVDDVQCSQAWGEEMPKKKKKVAVSKKKK